jgi:hypothetical protein
VLVAAIDKLPGETVALAQISQMGADPATIGVQPTPVQIAVTCA